ncbi:hypothetical protein T484DRAFT_1934121 [Baffinella frigidus]|nr:hypothetical protein T484DRAFT_1934121 [Cryptophyta sp. CCMP2293]
MDGQKEELKAVLFDSTGTLMGLAEKPGATYSRIAKSHGVACPAPTELDARFREVIGSKDPVVYAGAGSADAEARELAWWREVVGSVFGDAASDPGFDGCFAELFTHYGRGEAWTLYPEALATIAALKRAGWTVGVLSNFDSRLEGILADLEITQETDFLVLPRDTGVIKPHPGMVGEVDRKGKHAKNPPVEACSVVSSLAQVVEIAEEVVARRWGTPVTPSVVSPDQIS